MTAPSSPAAHLGWVIGPEQIHALPLEIEAALEPLPTLADLDVRGVRGIDLRAEWDAKLRARGLDFHADDLRAEYERAVKIRVHGAAEVARVEASTWVEVPRVEPRLTRRQARECVSVGRVLSPGQAHPLEADAWD